MNSQDKSTPTIGIVIPIYNVAKYLRECLDSVANQTYKNFHAVLVNDGSTDNSKEIALEYVTKDSRFVLIDKENGGQSSARNAGIAWFNGECNVCNSPLDKHSADSVNFECSQTPSLVSRPKFAENYESQTENPSVVLNVNSTKSSLRGIANAEAIQTARHTERSEVSKSRESQINNESMTKGRINKSRRFTQNQQITNDSRIAKVNSLLTAFAQNDESSHLTLYTNKNATNSTPPKIDYIIFLDSDDFWEVDLLEKCVNSALKYNAQIVWFSWKTFYDGIDNPSVNGGGKSTWLGIYGYTQEGVISNVDWFNRAKERNLYFANGWHIFTQFSHLQAINLRYLEGVIWEDVLFAELLFAQSERIAILPEMLVNYRVRQNNTTNFSGVKQKISHHI